MSEPTKSPFQQPARVFSDADEAVIRSLFKGEQGAIPLKVLKKAFLPVYDGDSSIGVGVDFWTGENYETMLSGDREVAILARIKTIKHVERVLLMLQAVANREDETTEQQKERQKKNSTK